MLAPALRRNAAYRTFQNLQESLLHALAGHVARYRHVIRLRRYLVDFIDIDDAAFGEFDVAVGVLEEVAHEVFDVLAYVAGLR